MENPYVSHGSECCHPINDSGKNCHFLHPSGNIVHIYHNDSHDFLKKFLCFNFGASYNAAELKKMGREKSKDAV